MLITEQAKQFAISAHKGQFRKSDPTIPKVAHTLAVGEMLAQYGYDDEVVAAGFLHDVVEDTKYTLTDIENMFGKNISYLVQTASEPDKSLSWHERKQHTINTVKTVPLRNKVIVAADKIHNTTDTLNLMRIRGLEVFKAFRAGSADQLWYVSGVYNSLIFNENPNTPIFVRLRDTVNQFRQEIKHQLCLKSLGKERI